MMDLTELINKNKDIYFINGINDLGKFGSKTPTGNSRVYNCQKCQRAFTRYEHLSRHIMSTHNKLKPYSCGICSRAFSRRDLLLRHAKNLHAGSELAVPRIRKQLKKVSREEKLALFHYKSDEDRSEESRSEPEERSDEELPSSPPDTKRLKLSVDMLVS